MRPHSDMKTIYALSIITVIALLNGCAQQPVSHKSPLELQAIQAKEFEATKKQGFAATLSVFQDMGYVVSSASLDTGLITAKSPTKQDFVLFVGQRMRDRKGTAFVEEVGKGRTKIRLNFVDSTQTSSGYGMRGEQDVPVETPDFYQDTFKKIQQAIFIRKNLEH